MILLGERMANGGWYGTKEEWARIEAPLLALDQMIEAFARSADLTVEKNHKDWPGRAMEWGSEIRCLLQIYLADENSITWNIWLCCSRDAQGERFWRQEFLVEKKPLEAFRDELPALLNIGREQLIEWSNHPESLNFAPKLRS
jgi:hypothetical protein